MISYTSVATAQNDADLIVRLAQSRPAPALDLADSQSIFGREISGIAVDLDITGHKAPYERAEVIRDPAELAG